MTRDVVLYTTEGCAPCRMVREFLTKRGVAFVVRDVGHDPEAMQELLARGGQTVPTVVISDGTVWAMRQGGTFASLRAELARSGLIPSP